MSPTDDNDLSPPLPPAAAPPITASSLTTGAQLFIFSLRQWRVAAHGKHCIHDALDPFYARFQAAPAVRVLDEIMSLLCAAAFRPVAINCPCKAELNEDETSLLACIQCVWRADNSAAIMSIEPFIGGRLATTFVRVMSAYVTELRVAGLNVTGRTYLRAVPNTVIS